VSVAVVAIKFNLTRELRRFVATFRHNVLATFQVHNLLTGTLLLSTFLFTKSCKIKKKNVKTRF